MQRHSEQEISNNAIKYVCHWDEFFSVYLEKKRSEGKHYNIALSHATKKLVRLIFAMEKSRAIIYTSVLTCSVNISF